MIPAPFGYGAFFLQVGLGGKPGHAGWRPAQNQVRITGGPALAAVASSSAP